MAAAACSLVDRIHERYFEDFDYSNDFILAYNSSPTKTMASTLYMVVLNHMQIKDVGDATKLKEYMKNALEVDLAFNTIEDWLQVSTMLTQMPMLRMLNLSFNPLAKQLECEMPAMPRLRTLIMNGTHLPWSTVRRIAKSCPNLLELHLSDNDFDAMNDPSTSEGPISETVQTLYLLKCGIKDWDQVMALLNKFPKKKNVYLSENPIEKIYHGEGHLDPTKHEGLEAIVLSKTEINDWDSIDALERFPDLKELRVYNTPLLEPLSDEEKMHLVTARLEKLMILNGSKITDEYRETAERFFIRYYQDRDPKPSHYHRLVDKHGNVERLAKVDLTPQSHVSVRVICDETNYKATVKLNVNKTVGAFMRSLEKPTGIPFQRMRLFYGYKDNLDVTEVRFVNQQIRMLHVDDDDRFHVQSKIVPSRKRSSQKEVQ